MLWIIVVAFIANFDRHSTTLVDAGQQRLMVDLLAVVVAILTRIIVNSAQLRFKNFRAVCVWSEPCVWWL